MRFIAIFIISTLVNVFIIINIVDYVLLGGIHFRYGRKCPTKGYLIQKPNHFDYQKYNECSGYSSAYLLRHLDIEADGMDLYTKITSKEANGYVKQKDIVHLLSEYGVKATYCRGNVNCLKCELLKGIPVIVYMKYNTKDPWRHYVPVVGFDEEYIYIADSLRDLVNEEHNENYNRKITISEFKKLWNTSFLKAPLYKNTYFSIKR